MPYGAALLGKTMRVVTRPKIKHTTRFVLAGALKSYKRGHSHRKELARRARFERAKFGPQIARKRMMNLGFSYPNPSVRFS